MARRAGWLLPALVLCACSDGEGRASEEPDGPVATRTLTDAQVAALVGLINGTEITAGRTVEPKLATPAGRALAALLIADHTRLQAAMPAFDGPRISPPQAHTLRAVLHSHSAMLTTLPGGYALDATFAATQVVDHAMAIDSLLRWRETARDPELRRALAAAIPIMESHLAGARALFAGLQRGSTGGPAPRDTTSADTARGGADGAEADTTRARPAARDTTSRGSS